MKKKKNLTSEQRSEIQREATKKAWKTRHARGEGAKVKPRLSMAEIDAINESRSKKLKARWAKWRKENAKKAELTAAEKKKLIKKNLVPSFGSLLSKGPGGDSRIVKLSLSEELYDAGQVAELGYIGVAADSEGKDFRLLKDKNGQFMPQSSLMATQLATVSQYEDERRAS